MVALTLEKRVPLDGCTCLSFPVLHHGLIAMQNMASEAFRARHADALNDMRMRVQGAHGT